MSGGVDSSVAAALLVRSGADVVGVSMQLYDQREHQAGHGFGSCCSLDDLADARRVSAALGIPHYILNLERQFGETVLANFVSEYLAGRTPIPCAHCNGDLKFATLVERALVFGADHVATGHYARVEFDAAQGRYLLRRGADRAKDQSYFLFSLTQAQLARARFPVGGMSKPEVREEARRLGLRVAEKPDSQELCFVPDDDYAGFVERKGRGAIRAGDITDVEGRVLGRHYGIHRFTIGQRKGLGLSAGRPLYVIGLRPESAQVVVGPADALAQETLTASDVNWIAGTPPDGPLRVEVQVRHRHVPAAATVEALPERRARVTFDAAQRAIAPGQAAVFYAGDEVVGGGWIERN